MRFSRIRVLRPLIYLPIPLRPTGRRPSGWGPPSDTSPLLLSWSERSSCWASRYTVGNHRIKKVPIPIGRWLARIRTIAHVKVGQHWTDVDPRLPVRGLKLARRNEREHRLLERGRNLYWIGSLRIHPDRYADLRVLVERKRPTTAQRERTDHQGDAQS